MATAPWARPREVAPWERPTQPTPEVSPAAQTRQLLMQNANREGTYAMWDTAGHKLQIPYGNVELARQQGYKFDTNKDAGGLTPAARYQKDFSAQPGTTQAKLGDLIKGAGKTGSDVLQGLGEGALHTLTATDPWARQHLPAFLTNQNLGFGPPANLENLQRLTTPDNPTQALARGAEQATEFMIPAGAGEKAAMRLADLVPAGTTAARVAVPAARVAANALTGGGVNALQGGDFTTGALAGGAGAGLGELARAAAPAAAETALRVTKPMRAHGRQIGQAALDYTSGITPSQVAESGQQAIGDLQRAATAQVPAGATMSLAPVRQAGQRALQPLVAENVPANINAGRELLDIIQKRAESGQAIPDQVSLPEAMALRRGIGKFLPASTWNPETTNRLEPLRNQLYGAMNESIGQSFPSIREADKPIASLIPVVSRAESVANEAPFVQRVAGRLARPTGALVGAGLAGTEGYREGGLPRALEYGAAGLLLPELLSGSTAQMGAARILNRAPQLQPLVAGSGLQLLDRSQQQ